MGLVSSNTNGEAPRWRVRAALCCALVATACAGSASDDELDEYVMAFQVTDERRELVERTEPLAQWLTEHTGTSTRVLTVQDDSAQITALATGQAHVGYLSGGPAWIGWQEFGLEAVAAEVRAEDGRTSYVAGLWVLTELGADTLEDLRGRDSCHTGELAGTGMFVPLGYLVRHGLVDTEGIDMDDVAALPELRQRFFGTSKVGGGYAGAFQCLSTGEGDVATGRDTAWDDFCAQDPEPWCRPREDYRFLPTGDGPDPAEPDGGLARVPSHPVMVSPHLPADDRQALRDAFLALNDDPAGRQVLDGVLSAAGLEPTSSDQHLGPYGEVLEHVPGIVEHLGPGGAR